MQIIERVYAAPTPCPTGIGTGGVNIKDCFAPAQKFGTLGNLVSTLSQNFLVIAGVIFFIIVLIAGLEIIRGAGSQDGKQMEKGKSLFTQAIVGFLIIFGAYWIVQIINFFTNGALGGIFQ